MSKRVECYQRQQAIIALLRKRSHLYAVSYSSQVQQLLDDIIDTNFIQRFFSPPKTVSEPVITDHDIKHYLAHIKQQLKQQQKTGFFTTSKQLIRDTVSNTISNKSKQAINKKLSNTLSKSLRAKLANKKQTTVKKHRDQPVKKAKKPSLKPPLEQHVQQGVNYLVTECSDIIMEELQTQHSQGWQRNNNDNDKKHSWKKATKQHIHSIKNRLLTHSKQHMVATVQQTVLQKGLQLITKPFVKTGKNISQALQQGGLSLFTAVKTIAFPPEAMSREQAAHEASKIMVTGLIMSAYTTHAELLAATLSSSGIPFADKLSTDVTDIASGISVLLAVSLLDQMDCFGVEAEQQHVLIMEILEAAIDSSSILANEMLNELNHAQSDKQT